MFRIKIHPLIGIFLILGPPGLIAQDKPSASMDDLYQMVQKQQQLIESQMQQIEAQKEIIDNHTKALQSLSTKLDQVAQAQDMVFGTDTAAPTEDQISLRERLAALEKSATETPEMPANVLTAGDFPGSIRIPGTNMAGKVGGFVRLGVVNSFDPIGSDDRFIVSTIPVPDDPDTSIEELSEGVTISSKRSRMNLDMRMDSSVGQFRAFIEGDFATDVDNSDVYRLRHAFGQYNRFVMGQTWSTLMDRQAVPEELDFEGLNSQVQLRHPIFRWTKGLGNQRLFSLAIENPSPDIFNGEGKSNIPDLVSTINYQRDRYHFQLGGVVRNLSGEQALPPENGGSEAPEIRDDSAIGWGLSASGSHTLRSWGKQDVFTWQVNYGHGFGRYMQDLRSAGGQDAVFDLNGNLEPIPAYGGYVSIKHYWKRDPGSFFGSKKKLLKDVRSTFVYGFVKVDNFDIQPDNAYKQTQRVTGNVIWSPIPNIDLGVEFLWGTRRNKNDSKGKASQLQFVATFKF